MTITAWTMALTLWLIAALHVYWGFGGLWPAVDAGALARTVVGARGVQRMPSLTACATVAAVLIGVGTWPLLVVGVLPPVWPCWLLVATGMAIAGVFLARGCAAYWPVWRRRVPEEPFATLDRSLYGPLCLALGLASLTLLWKGSTS